MQIALWVISAISFGLMTLVMSLVVPRPNLSEFELKRRRELGDTAATFGLKRLAARPRLMTLKHIVTLLLFACVIWTVGVSVQWYLAVLIVLLAILAAFYLARLGISRRLSQRLYRKIESHLIDATDKWRSFFKLIVQPQHQTNTSLPQSREELQHILMSSAHVVGHDEARLLLRSLDFYDRRVSSIMTPTDDIVTVEASEVLGPLVIDRLHRSGHTQFPVTNDEQVVGLLDLTDSANLKRRQSPEVRDVMRHEMVRVDENETLDTVLRMLIDVKQPCLLVIDETSDVIGMVSIGDVIRALTGWRQH